MNAFRIALVGAVALLSTACASGTLFGPRVIGGAAVGAGAGAVVGEVAAGAPGKGAAIGAVVGGVASALDWLYDKDHPAPQQQPPAFMPATSVYTQCAHIPDEEVREACERGAEAGAAAAQAANVRDAERRAAERAYCASRYGGCATLYQYSGGCGYCGSGAYGGGSYGWVRPSLVLRYELRVGSHSHSRHNGSRPGSRSHR